MFSSQLNSMKSNRNRVVDALSFLNFRRVTVVDEKQNKKPYIIIKTLMAFDCNFIDKSRKSFYKTGFISIL